MKKKMINERDESPYLKASTTITQQRMQKPVYQLYIYTLYIYTIHTLYILYTDHLVLSISNTQVI